MTETNHSKAHKIMTLFKQFKARYGIGREKILTWEMEQLWKEQVNDLLKQVEYK